MLWTNSLGISFASIPAGTFLMGSPTADRDADDDEFPQHPVSLTKPFELAIYPVTLNAFRQFVEATGYLTDAERDQRGGWGFNPASDEAFDLPFEQKPHFTWRNPGFQQTKDHPVINVSWNDATAFCEWLTQRESLTYRLPTEAEWEYSCRGGAVSRFYNSDEEESLHAIANIADLSLKRVHDKISWTAPWDDGFPFTSPVGSFQPNGFGIYDTLGNVWEWCGDWYADDHYVRAAKENPLLNPRGPDRGTDRVLRGGSWLNVAVIARCAIRNGSLPNYRDTFTGFRIVKVSS